MAAMNLNHEQFHNLMGAGNLVLVDYWAPWCGYCRRIAPAYEKIAQQYGSDLAVAKVNIDDEPQLAIQQGIQVIPTLILYRDGKAIASVVAPESKAAIDDFIRENREK